MAILLAAGNFIFAQNVSAEDPAHENGGISLGEKFDIQNILSPYQMELKYGDLKPGDSLQVAFTAEVTSVCKNKGCWMKIALPAGEEVMIKFKDYAFFVPKDIESHTVFINGLAYVEEMPVEEQKHYAEDAGLSPEEIAAIKEPKKTLLFLADGVNIKK
ncbi:DUF4920 domain-containing protein [Salinimicrobium catena]|uniref:DUF4920 domain-containing protein n=1 Tax=Salinimicrobium catena TaxID=390640 RepID=UPI002109DD0F|nr:DUF4920 domain-containing protein [Salinimicrobium catena]